VAPTSEDTLALLHRVPAFSALGEDDLRQVADVAVPRSFGAGEVVFHKGDDSDTCYVVRSGQARAVLEHPDGRLLTLAHFGPGDIFGELAMFDDERRSATVEALDEMDAIAILGSDMRRLLRAHPDITVKLLVALGRRLRDTNERLSRQSFQTVQSRVAAVLTKLVQAAEAEAAQAEGAAGEAGADTSGEDGSGATARRSNGGAGRGRASVEDGGILIRATQADLAQLAGSSRESASRFLAVLERAGIITQGRGRLTVHDAAALERYVY
jgi:CRP/FNR family transcriptional regulator